MNNEQYERNERVGQTGKTPLGISRAIPSDASDKNEAVFPGIFEHPPNLIEWIHR